jgi:hypothetical protein
MMLVWGARVFVYAYVCVRKHTHIRLQICMDTYTDADVHICMDMCVSIAWIYARTFVPKFVHEQVYVG